MPNSTDTCAVKMIAINDDGEYVRHVYTVCQGDAFYQETVRVKDGG